MYTYSNVSREKRRTTILTSLNIPSDLYTPLAAVVGLPFLVLVVDYVFRWLPVLEALRRSGPDFCIMGLGSSGAVFIDQKVIDTLRRVTHVPIQLDMVFLVIVILIFRQISFKLTEATKGAGKDDHSFSVVFRSISSCAFGLASVILVAATLYLGYAD